MIRRISMLKTDGLRTFYQSSECSDVFLSQDPISFRKFYAEGKV
jgi:hypothetical protein